MKNDNKTKSLSKVFLIVIGVIFLFLIIGVLSMTANKGEEENQIESPKGNETEEPAQESVVTSYSIKDVKADEKYFSASIFMQNVNQENVIKAIKEIKDKNYSPKNTIAFELFFFDDEDIAKKYLRVTDEESVAYDQEMKAWYVKMNNPPSETLEVLGKFIDIKNLNL